MLDKSSLRLSLKYYSLLDIICHGSCSNIRMLNQYRIHRQVIIGVIYHNKHRKKYMYNFIRQ